MVPSQENFRFNIFTIIKLGLKAKEIHGELADVFPESAPSFDTVVRWIRLFNDSRDSLEDEERSGRPRSFVMHNCNIEGRFIIFISDILNQFVHIMTKSMTCNVAAINRKVEASV